MPDTATFGLFLTAALVVAITPGPGNFYVLTRSLKGGRGEGIVSSFGNALGGLVHVFAAALGLSALLMASATAFTVVKFAGAAYLVYLGVRTLLRRDDSHDAADADHGADEEPDEKPAGASRNSEAFYQGIVAEMLNPKAAMFFLAFLPQFVNPEGPVVVQILLLGCISVSLNTSVDLVVAGFAGSIGGWLRESVRLRCGQRLFSGCALIGLGAYVAVAGEKR
jgi:threonine/homoserine/homoserine lactone efflux protein